MGIANAQRTINYIRILTEFISQPEYNNLIAHFGVVNEPQMATIGAGPLRSFYTEVYTMIRGIAGVGDRKGPIIGTPPYSPRYP